MAVERRPRIGIVLSGGGARGAYEAGIIRWIREVVPRELGAHTPVDIVTGTSVGAINACFLAATMEEPATQGERLAQAWMSMTIEDVISLAPRDMLRGLGALLGRMPPKPVPGQFRYGGLLETRGMEQFVFRMIPWRRIHHNIEAGRLRGLAVSATRVGTGHTHVFLHMASSEVPPAWSRNPFVRCVPTRIGPRHAMASAAIPLVFPSVKIAGNFYVDGSLRQNTPMSPALRLGANRILVVSLKHMSDAGRARLREQQLREERAQRVRELEAEQAYPKPLYVAGKALDALLLDATEYDMERLDRINQLLQAGTSAYGEGFVDTLGAALATLRGAPLRPIAAELVRPSVDIGEISSAFLRGRRYRVRTLLARRLLDRIASAEAANESDLISYLLFDGNYARELVELGYSDAEAQRERLLKLFDVR